MILANQLKAYMLVTPAE